MDDHVSAIRQRASSLLRRGRRGEAVETYRQLLTEHPELTDDWYELGYLLKSDGRFEEALAAYGEALARGVDRPEEVHLNRAVIYSDHLRQDLAAERELRAALSLRPDYVPALLNLGNLHEERGRRTEALECYGRITSPESACDPTERHFALRREALARLVHVQPPETLEDPLLERLKSAAAEPVALDEGTRANLYFSLGRCYDALGAFDEAFATFEHANRYVRAGGTTYDPARFEQAIDTLIRAFPMKDDGPPGVRTSTPGPEPVFVCGMFRSGSSLLEQALAGHARITAGGELDFLPRLVSGALRPFPASMRSVDAQRAASLAAEYRAHVSHLFPDTAGSGALVTDKRPDNFLLIGLIRRLFPTARILHTVRNPLDNCLSLYFQHLDPRVARYSTGLTDIGHYYGQYRRLMSHWKAMYPETILDFDYDAFVREPQPALEEALSFLGLDWDEACLDFHRRDETVKTASYWQVRRPLYREASGRWRHYAAHLGPLREALKSAGVEDVEEA